MTDTPAAPASAACAASATVSAVVCAPAWAISEMREKGATDAAIAEKKVEMEKMKTMLNNPLLNAAMTFIEPFPVGLLVTLVSAAVLRKRPVAALAV